MMGAKVRIFVEQNAHYRKELLIFMKENDAGHLLRLRKRRHFIEKEWFSSIIPIRFPISETKGKCPTLPALLLAFSSSNGCLYTLPESVRHPTRVFAPSYSSLRAKKLEFFCRRDSSPPSSGFNKDYMFVL